MHSENCFNQTASDKLTIKMIDQKLNARYKRMETNREEVEEGRKALAVMQNKM